MDITELRALNRQAVLDSAAVAALATNADLQRPTPCAGWLLDDLLRHMGVQHHGFAAEVGGHATVLADWQIPAPMPDPLAHYADSVELQIALKIPNGAERLQPGAAFAPGADAGAAGNIATIDRIVTLLGRSPTWPEPNAPARHVCSVDAS